MQFRSNEEAIVLWGFCGSEWNDYMNERSFYEETQVFPHSFNEISQSRCELKLWKTRSTNTFSLLDPV